MINMKEEPFKTEEIMKDESFTAFSFMKILLKILLDLQNKKENLKNTKTIIENRIINTN